LQVFNYRLPGCLKKQGNLINKKKFMIMKQLDLVKLDVKELDNTQLLDISGGAAWLLPAIGFQVLMEVIDGSFFEDVKKGYNEVASLTD
jgi:hypothetical protein